MQPDPEAAKQSVEEFSADKSVEDVSAACNEGAPDYNADACMLETLGNEDNWQEFKVHEPLVRP